MQKELLTINYRNATNRAIKSYAVTYGVPLPAGALREPRNLALSLSGNRSLPVQTRVLERHPDRSIKWLLLDFALGLKANEKGQARLVQTAAKCPSVPGPLVITESPAAIKVRGHGYQAFISRKQFSIFEEFSAGGRNLIQPGSDIVVENVEGKRFYASLARRIDVRVLETGPLRAVVQVSGRHTAEDDATLLDFRVRYTFRAGDPGVIVAYKFTNREQPETGVQIGNIGLDIPAALGPRTVKFVRQTNHGRDWFSRKIAVRENIELMAGKAVNPEAKARYGSAAEGKVLIRSLESLKENPADYPYYLRPGNARTDMTGGIRQMYPYVGMSDGAATALGFFFDMEINFPKGLQAERNLLRFDIWPAWAGDLKVRRGQSKEHRLYLCLANKALSPDQVESIYFDHEVVGIGVLGGPGIPLELSLDPEYARRCEILQLHRWLPYDLEKYGAIETKLGTAGAKGGISNRGMFDVGDHVNPDRSWSHNNENDALLDMLREYYRRAEPTMLPASAIKAYHLAHVDFIAFDPDPLRAGTTPAHCPEHTDGATYPSHMWVDGLMAAYGITGETDFRDAALAIGENMLRWQKMNPTIFYADSRECGWPMLAFLRLHEFTGEKRWLDACEQIFRFYRRRMDSEGLIRYALPHGVGTQLLSYGEFIAWRALFFYWEITGKTDVKKFLVRCLPKVSRHPPGYMVPGWASNDLFPAWAAFQLTGDSKYLEENHQFLRFLMSRSENFPWGGIDMHPFLAELHRRGELVKFA